MADILRFVNTKLARNVIFTETYSGQGDLAQKHDNEFGNNRMESSMAGD